MSRPSHDLLYYKLLRKIKTLGGGELTADSVDSSHIANGSIVTADISDGAITVEKFHHDIQFDFANILYDVFNVKYPGWYGTFTIKNANASNPETITFSVEAHTYNPITENMDVSELLASTTLLHNQQEVITLPIYERLTNKDTRLIFLYTLSNGTIDSTNEIGVNIEEANAGIYELSVRTAFIHNGNIEFEVTIAEPPPPVAPTITFAGTYDTGDWPNRMFNDTNTAPYGAPAGIYFVASANNMSIQLNLTFPAGSTRVRLVTSPSVNWLSNLPDFVPTAGQTSANITITKINPGYYDSQTSLQLLLNTNTNSSYNFLVTAHYEL